MFLYMLLQALGVEKGSCARTACDFLGRLQLFDPFPFPPLRFACGMSERLKLNAVHNKIHYNRGGILFTSDWRLLNFHFWIPFLPLKFTIGLSGNLNLNDAHNRIRYVRGGIHVQYAKFGIPPQGPQGLTLNPTGEGFLSDRTCAPSTQASDLFCSSTTRCPPLILEIQWPPLRDLEDLSPQPPDPTLNPKTLKP